MKLQIRVKPSTRKFLKLVRKWRSRTKQATKFIAFETAQYAYSQLLQRLPRNTRVGAYRRSLRLVRVDDGQKDRFSYAIWSQPSRKLSGVMPTNDPSRLLLHVRHKRSLATPSPAVQILVDNNPWTFDTLPFQPAESEAVIDYEMAGKLKVASTASKRRQNESSWKTELQRLGIVLRTTDVLLKASKKAATLGYGLELEFGKGPLRAVPHWRPVLRSIARKGILGIIRQNPKRKRYLSQLFTKFDVRDNLNSMRKLRKISKSTAAGFKVFSQKIMQAI